MTDLYNRLGKIKLTVSMMFLYYRNENRRIEVFQSTVVRKLFDKADLANL